MNTTDDNSNAHNPLSHLFDNNAAWVERKLGHDPEYFSRLAHQQAPEYLWIGCSDSRVPANQIIGLPPGEVFVHRNIANVVVHSDLNCLSVIQFAVDLLKVKHIMVVGHYGCSGVGAALVGRRVGLADNWLRHVEDVRDKHAHAARRMADGQRAASPAGRTQHHRADRERVPHDDRQRCVGARPGTHRARLDVRRARRPRAQPGHDDPARPSRSNRRTSHASQRLHAAARTQRRTTCSPPMPRVSAISPPLSKASSRS